MSAKTRLAGVAPEPGDCLPICGATGVWGVFWRGPDKVLNCLQYEGAGAVFLKGDENGLYFANAAEVAEEVVGAVGGELAQALAGVLAPHLSDLLDCGGA